MGVLDNFLSILRLDNDEYDDEDFDVEDFDTEEEEEYKPKRSFFKKEKKYSDDLEFDDESFEHPVRNRSKVTPMRPTAKKSGMAVCVIKPNEVNDTREITDTLLSNRTVILNLEGLDLEVAQRIIDFTSGATYAIAGNLQKISSYIFLVTPTNVDISGDLQDLLGSSFDFPSMGNRY